MPAVYAYFLFGMTLLFAQKALQVAWDSRILRRHQSRFEAPRPEQVRREFAPGHRRDDIRASPSGPWSRNS